MANIARTSTENYIDFLLELKVNKVTLSQQQIILLKKNGHLKSPFDRVKPPLVGKDKWKADFTLKKKSELQADKRTSILIEQQNLPTVLNEDDLDSHLSSLNGVVTLPKQIVRNDWMPESIVYHKKEFVKWIDSIILSFQDRVSYNKFNLYVQQAETWFAENISINDFGTYSERYDYAIQEFDRCKDNSLYAVLKYGYLQESSLEYGRRKYEAGDDYTHHKITCYLVDCGYSLIIGKPRQIGETSIIGLIAVMKMILTRNYFIKFITEDEKTGVEIFDDKIKFGFSELPEWFKPNVLNDRDRLFKIGEKAKKGGDKGVNSKIEIVPPSRTAINGGSPQLVFVDEIGSIPILTDMVNEGRPTMFWKNPTTGKLEQKRQLILLGTGTTGKGGGAYEKEWSRIYGLWTTKEFESGIVPIFFDWTTRCSKEEYDRQKKYYYGSRRTMDEKVDSETSRIQFHQHYPTTPRDMFIFTDKTLMSRDFIDKNLLKIRNMREEMQPVHGYFKPIFDKNKPVENEDVPFKIIGAEFVAANDDEMDKTTAVMLHRPKQGWIDRYYQGTDPISSDTGSSKMASAIWDKQYKTISCLVNFRQPSNPKASFLQSMLMGIYYDTNGSEGVRELLEKNIGLAYRNYKESKGYLNSLVINGEIEESLQSGASSDVGIDTKGVRKDFIVARMGEMFRTFGDNIYLEVLFHQLTTFVCKATRTGKPTWQPLDKRHYYDDALDAAVFAYICSLSFFDLIPKNITTERIEKKKVWKNVYDKDFNQSRILVS